MFGGWSNTIANVAFSPTTNNYNASLDQINAVSYIISQDPSKNALIVADVYTNLLFSAYAHGQWYN
jgi:hypothetical protein